MLIIQEKHDPFGTYAEISEQVTAKEHIRCIEVEGDRHQYTDTVAIGRLINLWVNETQSVVHS